MKNQKNRKVRNTAIQQEATEIIDARIEQLEKQRYGVYFVEQIADYVYKKLDPTSRAGLKIRYFATLEFRQMVRGRLRGTPTPEEIEESQGVLIPMTRLQKSYPATREGKSCYVRREYLTYRERRELADSLRRIGGSWVEHAREVDLETDALVKAGKLEPDDQQTRKTS